MYVSTAHRTLGFTRDPADSGKLLQVRISPGFCRSATNIVVSPDGLNVYCSTRTQGACYLNMFSRNPADSGKYTLVDKIQISCANDSSKGITSVTVSPDGLTVYILKNDRLQTSAILLTLDVFSPNTSSGKLYVPYVPSRFDLVGSIFVSPDGLNVYALISSGLVTFARDVQDSGKLYYVGFWHNSDLDNQVATISPDGLNYYVFDRNAIAIYARNPQDSGNFSYIDSIDVVVDTDEYEYEYAQVTMEGMSMG